MRHLPYNENKILSCMGNINPESVAFMFGISPDKLIAICHKYKVAFDVSQVHEYNETYRNILIKYLDEPRDHLNLITS